MQISWIVGQGSIGPAGPSDGQSADRLSLRAGMHAAQTTICAAPAGHQLYAKLARDLSARTQSDTVGIYCRVAHRAARVTFAVAPIPEVRVHRLGRAGL